MREEAFIATLCARVPHQALPWGPGDDAALLEPGPGSGRRVITTDTYVEDVHFLRAHPPSWLAEKLLAANFADVSAMGATPEGYTLSASLPRDVTERWWLAFCDGLAVASTRAQVTIAGGDITASPDRVIFSVTAYGTLSGPDLLTRSGGQAGDSLMLLGVPGLSRAGWERWSITSPGDWGGSPPDNPDPALLAHLRPRPDLAAGSWALSQGAHAGMDLSDGLARDGQRLAEASCLDLIVDLDQLPPLPSPIELDLEQRLAGGEEHDLMVLVPPGLRGTFESRGFIWIGEARTSTGEPVVHWLQSGRTVELNPRPFEHF